MQRLTRAIGIWLVLAGTADQLFAQDVYVTGAWLKTWREPGWYPSLATPDEQPPSTVTRATIGAGIRLSQDVAVEGTVGLNQQQSIRWHYNYLFGDNRDELTTDRDIPVVGTVHVTPLHRHRVSAEFAVGGGMSFHRGLSYMTADCGSGSLPRPCVPVSPPRLGDNLTTREWLLAFAVDVPIRILPRLEIAPTVGVSHMIRGPYLTGHNHRGPYTGGGTVPGFGVNVRYLIHGRPPAAGQTHQSHAKGLGRNQP